MYMCEPAWPCYEQQGKLWCLVLLLASRLTGAIMHDIT